MINKNIILFLVIILAIPLIGLAIGEGIKYKFDAELRDALIDKIKVTDKSKLNSEQLQFINSISENIDRINVDVMCKIDSTDAFCQTNENINLLNNAAIFSTAVSLSLICFIWIIGKFASSNRKIVLFVFKPTLYLSLLGIIFLVIINSGIAIGALFYGESVFIGRFHPFILVGIGFVCILAILSLIPKIFGLIKKANIFVVGKIVPRQTSPKLWNLVEKISKRVGSLMPDHIVVGLDPNFFVTEASVSCLDGVLTGRTLYFSLTLSHIMTIDEVSAVLGHELSHFKGQDTVFSQKFYPIYRGTTDSINSLQSQIDKGNGGVALLPAIAILCYFLNQFSIVEKRISRHRELIADKYGSAVSNPKVYATALAKVHAFAPLWGYLQQLFVDALKDGKYFTNAGNTFADMVQSCAKPEILTNLPKQIMHHPTDSHPTLAIRLISLKVNLDEIKDEILVIKPDNSALILIPEAEELEKEISAAYQVFLAKLMGLNI